MEEWVAPTLRQYIARIEKQFVDGTESGFCVEVEPLTLDKRLYLPRHRRSYIHIGFDLSGAILGCRIVGRQISTDNRVVYDKDDENAVGRDVLVLVESIRKDLESRRVREISGRMRNRDPDKWADKERDRRLDDLLEGTAPPRDPELFR